MQTTIGIYNKYFAVYSNSFLYNGILTCCDFNKNLKLKVRPSERENVMSLFVAYVLANNAYIIKQRTNSKAVRNVAKTLL